MTQMTEVAARTVDVWKVYGSGEAQVIALRGVTVDLDRGAFTAIMGPSGPLRMISGEPGASVS